MSAWLWTVTILGVYFGVGVAAACALAKRWAKLHHGASDYSAKSAATDATFGYALTAIFWPVTWMVWLPLLTVEREVSNAKKAADAAKRAAAYKSPPDPKDYRGTEVK